MSPGQKIKTETEMPPCSCRQPGSPLDSGTGEILQEGKCSPEDRDPAGDLSPSSGGVFISWSDVELTL